MGRKKIVDDDDDDDMPLPRGRPRAPEEFGPPKPEPHQRKEFVARLQSILSALELPDLGRDERLYLQRILWRADWLSTFDPKRFTIRGEDRVILLLRSIAETTNGTEALTLPIMKAVSSCLYDAWTDRGLAWLEALDRVPLLEILRTLSDLGLQDRLGDALRWKLTQILGSPFAPQPAKLKTPARKMGKPPTVSQATWDEVVEMKKADRRQAERRRPSEDPGGADGSVAPASASVRPRSGKPGGAQDQQVTQINPDQDAGGVRVFKLSTACTGGLSPRIK